MSTDTLRNIYSYSTAIYVMYAWFKVGETANLTGERIKQQDGTSNPEPLVQLTEINEPMTFNLDEIEEDIQWEIKTDLSDEKIRTILCKKFGYYEVRKDASREWVTKYDPDDPTRLEELRDQFKTDEEFINHIKDELLTDINLVIKNYSKNDTRKEYNPYFYKVYIERLFFYMLDQSLNSGKKMIEFALELAPRFGKTAWIISTLIKLFTDYNYKLCVLPSYWLSSLSSFEKALTKWKGFDEYIHYVKEGDDLESEIDKWYGKKMIVVETSLHMTDTRFNKLISILGKVDSSEKISIIDEADFGAWKQTDMINKLESSLTLYLSGSGLEKIISNLKNLEDRIIQWSYTDMILVKHGQHPLFF